MRAFLEVLSLELKALWRSKTALLLLLASVGWVLLAPRVVHGDGTPAGTREVTIAYALGGVFALAVVALVASATATFAKERETKRLQLTMIRPLGFFPLALGKFLAHVLTGAGVLLVASAALALSVDVSVPCRHVLKPVMPTPREEARTMYDAYMADPGTPAEVKKAPKTTVMRILENRAADHFDTISTNAPVAWHFAGKGDAVRLRITNRMEMRQQLLGVFRSNGRETVLSNMTQTVLTVPFAEVGPELEFANRGRSTLMLRPRKDIELLAAADGFLANLVRADLVLLSVMALILAFAVLLSAGLGRPVALFVAYSFLFLGLVSPDVVEQYPDELHASFGDRVGLAFTRFAAEVTRPVSTYSPIARLSKDECVENADLLRAGVLDLAAVPLVMLLLAGLVLPRKQDGV